MLAFYIVDDDVGVRRVLSNIIVSKNLGRIVGETDDGNTAYREILRINPDIVLMDLLIPGIDGIETIRKLKKAGINSYFIMISQVDTEDMVTLAYQSGIEFYIHKPVNVIEVVSVINRVRELINLKKSLTIIHQTVEGLNPKEHIPAFSNYQPPARTIDSILSDLGITGEAGSMDIKKIIELIQQKKNASGEYYNYKLSNMYEILSEHYTEEGDPYQSSAGIKAIEQRIRRAVSKALQNIATLGIENPNNPNFTRYSTCLFDFKEVKQEMDFLRDKSSYHGKINVKKFLEGIILQLSK
jgi:two-component system response regulator YcbB